MDSEIAVRAYLAPQKLDVNNHYYGSSIQNKFDRILVLDTETTTDRYQNLKFGSFKIYHHNVLVHDGIFYNAGSISAKEITVITNYCTEHRITLYLLKDFIQQIFLPEIYSLGTLCIGFNLPFDLSRLAIDYGYARARMKGGFSFKLTNSKGDPRLLIRHIDGTKAFIRFGSPIDPYKRKVSFRGNFLDLHTFVFALTNEKHSLESACKLFNTEVKKTSARNHGKVTTRYMEYNLNDVDATYSLYLKLKQEYELYGLDLPINKVYSSASIGKACLRSMGIMPFVAKSKIPNEILGYVTTTYFGARSEVKIRKTPVLIDLLDFTSMYPTMCILMSLWRFIICDRHEYEDCSEWARDYVDKIKLDDLRLLDTWKLLHVIVELQPEYDILPVRSKFGDRYTYNIATNYLTADGSRLWYTLADVIASKLLTGKSPKVVRAIRFTAIGMQEGLHAIRILGKAIDPRRDDFFKILVEHRRELQIERESCMNEDTKALLDKKQKAIKTLVNATGYGIFMEINTEERECEILAYGLSKMQCHVNKREKFGDLFNPLIATFITGGARLVLAAVECILARHGTVHAFCDTDSMAVPPEYTKEIQRFFQSLNPYGFDTSLFKVEHSNVWFYGISAKRYVLYHINERGQISVVKASSHGLGHLLNPLQSQNNDWHEQIWLDILHFNYGKTSVTELNEKYSNAFAISEFTISTPTLMRRLGKLNEGKKYESKIKPFNFCIVGVGNHPDETTGKVVKPLSPYRRNATEVVFGEFVDHNTGKSLLGQEYWKKFVGVFWDYLNHLESKFDGDVGVLTRKHVKVYSVIHVGKESNNLDIAEVLGVEKDDYVIYNNIKDIIISKKDLILSLRPRDVRSFGIMKETLRTVQRSLHEGNIPRIKHKTMRRILLMTNLVMS